ncbi:3,4-dihydroxy-2-butanone-4-phosphate synthase [Pelagibacteraceae bacterium]|nr:3,4-dihydroxy-2-butanone-4-phosphate synthase [Pelagibacteraceae bacterium]
MTAEFISSIEEIIEDQKNGKMVIMVDDEGRENEGDLILPAEKVDDKAVNFMAKYGRGLICLPLTASRVRELNLPLMAQNNQERDPTAFTISIEAKEGVTTGISAQDRAITIQTAIDKNKCENDITSPGHVFPLVARDGGVLVRAGHTEASVDLARLSGNVPASVICEIMNDDGTMARVPDLIKFSQKHQIKIGRIVDLISYRLEKDTNIKLTHEGNIDLMQENEFDLKIYESLVDKTEQIVLSKGDISNGEPIMVRVYVMNIFDDIFGDYGSGSETLKKTIDIISEEGRGILILVRDSSTSVISHFMNSKSNLRENKSEPERSELRIYGMGAQILNELNVRKMILLTNTDWKFIGLEAYGIDIVEKKFLSEII